MCSTCASTVRLEMTSRSAISRFRAVSAPARPSPAAMLRQHAASAGVTARIDLNATDLPGKVALVATGHAIALVPGVPRRDPHPAAPLLLRQLLMSFR
jgi:hypothetical protein